MLTIIHFVCCGSVFWVLPQLHSVIDGSNLMSLPLYSLTTVCNSCLHCLTVVCYGFPFLTVVGFGLLFFWLPALVSLPYCHMPWLSLIAFACELLTGVCSVFAVLMCEFLHVFILNCVVCSDFNSFTDLCSVQVPLLL
jgi:hypothetical protein